MRFAHGLVVVAVACVGFACAGGAPPPCVSQAFEGSSFTVCAFDVARHDLRLAWQGPDGQALRGFAAAKQTLQLDERRVRFAMNAGMFDDAGAPIGLFVANRREEHALNAQSGEGNFFLKPNGVFVFDGAHVRIVETDAFRAEAEAPKDESLSIVAATQSGPLLVIDGALHPSIQADGPSRYVRNGVGVRDAQHAVFAISDEPVSFGKLARFLRDGLGCRNALYLDGAVSSLWVPLEGRMDADHPLGPMLFVEAKPRAD